MRDVSPVPSQSERGHAPFSPSASKRRFLCPRSYQEEQGKPDVVKSWTRQGQVAHDVAEKALELGISAQAALPLTDVWFEEMEPGEYLSVNIYLTYVREIIALYDDAEVYLETRVDPLIGGPNMTSGYVDVCVVSRSFRALHVIDYKHGAGVEVKIKDETQPIQYGTGVLLGSEINIRPEDIDYVFAAIVQPRCFSGDDPVQEDTYLIGDIYAYVDKLEKGLEASMAPDAPYNPGPKQCQFCKAKYDCKALQEDMLGLITFNGAPAPALIEVNKTTLPPPKLMDVERLAFIKSRKSLFLSWLEAVDEHLDTLLDQGVEAPGYKRVMAYARREYHQGVRETAQALSALSGLPVEDLLTEKVPSITEAQKLVVNAFKSKAGKGKKRKAAEDAKRAFAFLTTKTHSGKRETVREDDNRISIHDAQQFFSHVKL